MIRLDRVPINLYRRDPSGRNTKVCKAPFSIREHGTNTQETRRAWLAQTTKLHGVGNADLKKADQIRYQMRETHSMAISSIRFIYSNAL